MDYKTLSEHSGVPSGTLKRWSNRDADGIWGIQGERHKTNLRPEIDKKVIEKTSLELRLEVGWRLGTGAIACCTALVFRS
jgi:hypothetical protein